MPSDKDTYIPPYTVSEEAVNLIAEISSAIEHYHLALSGVESLRLRRINRIKTIRGSTAIEGNTLTEEQITAVLDGKRVVAPKGSGDIPPQAGRRHGRSGKRRPHGSAAHPRADARQIPFQMA